MTRFSWLSRPLGTSVELILVDEGLEEESIYSRQVSVKGNLSQLSTNQLERHSQKCSLRVLPPPPPPPQAHHLIQFWL